MSDDTLSNKIPFWQRTVSAWTVLLGLFLTTATLLGLLWTTVMNIHDQSVDLTKTVKRVDTLETSDKEHGLTLREVLTDVKWIRRDLEKKTKGKTDE